MVSCFRSMPQKRIDDQPTISRGDGPRGPGDPPPSPEAGRTKQTAQRDTILRTFLETRDHLSTDELHRLVKKKDDRWLHDRLPHVEALH